MLTLNPPIRYGTEGAEEFSPPQWDGFLQSHSGEGKSEVFPYRNHPAGASPTHSARLFVRAQTSASKDEAARDTILPCSCRPPPPPPFPACPLPTVRWHCPAQLGRVGTTGMEVLMLRGCPSPAALHKIQVAAASSKFSEGLLSPH